MELVDKPLTFNDALSAAGIGLSDVIVFRHRPYEAELNRIFEWIAAERSDLFDCYQSTHSARVEGALTRAKFVASFIRYGGGSAVFVGLHAIRSFRTITTQECIARPKHQELMSLGMVGIKATDGRTHLIEFDLPTLQWHADWKGRLIIDWPPPDRSWWRWADRNTFSIEALLLESAFAKMMPPWDQLVFTWQELSVLPASWAAAMSQWRGIYLIRDLGDGKPYVGSAYGAENILQRWREYARSGHGGNKHLRGRDPANFHFAILQRLSPDLSDAEVIKAESTWKERLLSRWPSGLNDN